MFQINPINTTAMLEAVSISVQQAVEAYPRPTLTELEAVIDLMCEGALAAFAYCQPAKALRPFQSHGSNLNIMSSWFSAYGASRYRCIGTDMMR